MSERLRLAEIEACFRTNKHDMKIRPIFHRNENRVRARIAIRCMAFRCAGIFASGWTGRDAG